MHFITDNNYKLRVDKSTIHGRGLFANEFIAAGAVIGTIVGIRTSEDDMYTLWLEEDHGVRMLCKFKYINHSDEPNVILYDTLEVCALRDIAPGEEMTHDYTVADYNAADV